MSERSPQADGGARFTLTACILAALCEGFDLQSAGVAAPGVIAQFAPTPDQLGTFFSASSIGLFVGALFGGRLSDFTGRKPVLITSLVLFGAFSICTGLVSNIHALAWCRLLTGAGLGGAFPNLVALVGEASPQQSRRANIAFVYGGMPFGGAIASLLSLLVAPGAWRFIFIAGGIAPLLLAPLMIWAVRDRPVRDAGQTGELPQPARAGSLKEIFAAGRALPTLLLWSGSLLALLTLYLMLSWLPTLLMGSGFSKSQAAGAQIAFNLGGWAAVLLTGPLLQGRSRAATVWSIFIAMPLMVLFLSKAPHELSLVVGIVFLLGAAVIAGQGYLYTVVSDVYPVLIRGMGVGAMVAVGRSGSIVGPKLGGALKQAGHSSSQLLLDILPLVIACSLIGLAFFILRDRTTVPGARESS